MTHWLDWRDGKSSWFVNVSPVWYIVPLYLHVLTGARRPAGVRCSSYIKNRAENSNTNVMEIVTQYIIRQ